MAKQTFTTGQVLLASQLTNLQQTAMLGGSASIKTVSYTLVSADAGSTVAMNSASSTTITVNQNLFSAGDIVTIYNTNTGVSTITAGTATVTTSGSLALSQNQGGVLHFTSASAAIFFQFATPASGDITEVQAGVGISVTSGTGPIPIVTNSSTDLITTAGDLLYGSAADTMVRLGIGSTGNVLTVASGVPSWAAPAGGSTFVGVAARKSSSDQTIANNTYTNLVFDAEVFDTNGFHSDSVNNTRFTVPSGKAGYYSLVCNFEWASNGTGERRIRFRLNGTSTLCNYAIAAMSGVGTGMAVSYVTSSLSVGDYIEVNVLQTSGGNLDIYTFADGQRFAMTYLGA